MPGNGANKRGASQPWRGRATQRGGRRNRDLLNDRGSTTENGFKGFSLADEARHTSQHSSHWDATGTLRSKPVSFVSAGSIEPLKELEGQLEEEEQDIHQEQDEDQTLDSPITLAPAGLSSSNKLEEGAHNSTGGFGNPVVEDSVENSSIIGPEELEQHIARAAEADGEKTPGHQAESTSFFFDLKGERKVGVTSKVPVPIPTASYESASSSGDEVILFKGRDATPVRQVAESSPDPTSITLSQMHTEITAVEENLSIPTNTGRRRGRSNTARGGTKGQRSKRQHRRLKPQSEHDGLAAIAADYMANMRENGEILDLMCSQQTPDSRNTRDLGGTEDDESDQPAFLSVSMSDKMACERQEGQGDAYDSESELDDATLAKLLQGHVLDIGEEPASNGLASSDSDSSDSDLPISKKTMQWEAQMDDFDPMDWERPSLRRKKGGKGTKTQAVLNTSDDELRESLDKAWKKDRLKKSERKKQREELRAFGMLGKHAEKPGDLRTKYPAGMNIEQVGEEIRDFLRGTAETVSMPPMDTHARKIVHEIANKFNIKSKSTGKADQRRTSLYRTKRTMQYSEKSFDQAIARIHRRFLPRLDTKGKRGSKAPPQRTSHAAASYREGEVVGGAAPELGSENRGRTMLEKMGWSTGTALGALDNKGILQPVPQTMKKSKAGLG